MAANAQYRLQVAQAANSDTPPGDVRFEHAMRIVTSGDYCVKCHSVADFHPEGSPRTHGPDLATVYQRLRPDYLRQWIAKPTSVLPYTGMPVNIKYNPQQPEMDGVSQELYHGNSIQQLDALVDLLMNYDRYTQPYRLIAPLVRPATAVPAPDQPAAAGGAAAQ